MDELSLLHVRLAGIRGLDTGNQMGKARITGLRKMSRRKHVFLAQTQLLVLPEIMLHPNLPQQLDVRQAREERRGCFLIERREQLRPISPDLLQKCLLLFFGNSSSPFLDTPLISLEPVYGHPLVQPLWVLSCQFVESGP